MVETRRIRTRIKKVKQQKLYVVYTVYHNDELYYIGHGVIGREKHVNSGCSHVYELNKLHFEGVEFEVKIEKFENKELAATREEYLIRKLRPKLNKVFLTTENQISKMRCLSELKRFCLNQVATYRQLNKCRHSDVSTFKTVLDMIGTSNCLLGVYTKSLNKKTLNKALAIINSLNKESSKTEFLNYFYCTMNNGNRLFALSDAVLIAFHEHLKMENSSLLVEFDLMIKQRNLTLTCRREENIEQSVE